MRRRGTSALHRLAAAPSAAAALLSAFSPQPPLEQDDGRLTGIADGTDAVVSTIGVTGRGGDPWRVDHAGTLALLDTSLSVGTSRFAFVNVLHAAQIPADLTRAKAAFAAAPRRATDHHLIVNPSGCFSDLGTYLTMAKRGVALVISGRRAQISPIDGADLATPIREQLENGTTGDLGVGGPQTLTHREVAELAFTTLDRTPRIVSMPMRLACIGLAPARMVAPSAAGLATFLLAGLGQDTAALPYGHCLLADHFQQLTAQEEARMR